MERVPQSIEVRELESPTLRDGDTLSFTRTVTAEGSGMVWDQPRDVWVTRADGALEHYPDAFR